MWIVVFRTGSYDINDRVVCVCVSEDQANQYISKSKEIIKDLLKVNKRNQSMNCVECGHDLDPDCIVFDSWFEFEKQKVKTFEEVFSSNH
jgi:hypothetical protein